MTGAMTSVGNGWYRCSVNVTTGTITTWSIDILGSDVAARAGANSAPGNIYIWGAQLESRSSLTEYTATTTAPITRHQPVLQTATGAQPRFDHDPATGDCKGLLIEGGESNLLLESVVKANYYSTTNSIFVENSGIAPDGTNTATTVYSNNSANVHKVVAGSINQTYTLSVFIKKPSVGEYNLCGVYLYSSGSVNNFLQYTTFDIENGTIHTPNSSGTNGHNSRIAYVGNGWYRCSVTAQLTANDSVSSGIMYTPSTTYAAFLLWGAQLELNHWASSYIPTSGSSVTRSQENVTYNNIDTSDWYSAGKGTAYIEAASQGFRTSQGFGSMYQTGSGNDWHGFYSNTPSATNGLAAYTANAYNINYTYPVGGGNSSSAGNDAYLPGVFFKGAHAYSNSEMSFAFDGKAASSSGSYTITPHNTLSFSQLYESGFHASGVYIKKYAFYPDTLSTAEITALTENN
jgi:hypothetical protein